MRLVPVHPADQKGKTPVNVKHGVFVVFSRGATEYIGRVDFNPMKKSKL